MSKNFSRRWLLKGTSLLTIATMQVPIGAEAMLLQGYGATSVTPPPPTSLPLRNVININNFSFITNDYAMIDHIKPGVGVFPNAPSFQSGITWPAALDANGWNNANDPTAGSQPWSVSFQIPDPASFAGPYRLIWQGNGQLNIHFFNNTVAQPTAANAVNCSNPGNTFVWTSTGGASTASVDLTFSTSSPAGPMGGTIVVSTTGTSGFFIKNMSLIRVADATDFTNGLIWRAPWKQSLVNLDPSAIRFMNMLGGNSCRNCRFENRTLPSNATYYGSQGEAGGQWTTSPVYPFATGTNQFVIGTATPTASNTKTTPASMVHGELATAPFTNGFSRCSANRDPGNSNGNIVSNISNHATAPVVTVNNTTVAAALSWASGTGLATLDIFGNAQLAVGDVVQLLISGATPSGYNGNFTFTCTVRSSFTRLTCTMANPGSPTAGGTPAYAGHLYNNNDHVIHGLPLTTVVGVMNSTTTITGISNTSGIVVGDAAFGPGVPTGATVASIVVNTSVTLSSATTLTAGNVHVSFRTFNNLDKFPTKVTVVDATHYSISTVSGGAIDTTIYPSFHGTASSAQYIAAQVGSGNDRIGYPWMFADGATGASTFGNFLNAGDYKTIYFDKNLTGQTDGAGNPIYGVWMWSATPQQAYVGHSGDMPIEVCVALVNELNAMSPAHPIGMWMNLAAWGLSPLDPDYTTASDWNINSVDVVMNPSSIVRASGYSSLVSTAPLYIEYGNELWNAQDNHAWLINRAMQRWPTTIGQSIYQDMQALRSTQAVRSIKASNPPGLSRIHYFIGVWGFVGMGTVGAGNDFGGNYAKCFGGSTASIPNQVGDWYTNDSTVTGGSWETPVSNHDGCCPATYFDPPDSYYDTISGTGTFTDDVAMYNGTNNTSNGGGNYTGAANTTQAVTNFVNQVINTTSGSQSITQWATVLMPVFSSKMAAAGKVVVNYEGGTDWAASLGGTQTANTNITTQAQLNLVIAAINSSQWATAQVGFFNTIASTLSNCFMPSIYTWIGNEENNSGTISLAQRWAYTAPDTYGGTTTEGQGLLNNPTWVAMSSRNVALPS